MKVVGLSINFMETSPRQPWSWTIFGNSHALDASEARSLHEAVKDAMASAEFYNREPGARPGRSAPVEAFQLGQCHCQRCDHRWRTRRENKYHPPKRCASCRSPFWQKPARGYSRSETIES